jgi:ATP-dependent DNA ligase
MSPRVSRTLPTVEPILLTPRGDPFDDPAWLFEPKYDGYRGLLYVSRKGGHFRSKRGNILKRFEELATGCGRSCRSRRRSWTARWWR